MWVLFFLLWTRDHIKPDHSITFVKPQIRFLQAGLLDDRGPGIKLCGPKAQVEIWHAWAMPYLFLEIIIENNGIIRFWWGERCCKWCPLDSSEADSLFGDFLFGQPFPSDSFHLLFHTPMFLGCTGFPLSWNNSGSEQLVGAQFLYIERLLFTKCRNVYGINIFLYAF